MAATLDWLDHTGARFDLTDEEIGKAGYMGFVYLIENLAEQKTYIGKKLFTFAKRRSVKGKKKKYRAVSDWRTYYGSNDALNSDVAKLGPEHFRRTILHLCLTKSECSYLEAREQIIRNSILDKASYNDWIQLKVTRKHLAKRAAAITAK